MALLFTTRDERRSGRWDDDTAAAWSMSDTLDLFFYFCLVYICAAQFNKELERKKAVDSIASYGNESWKNGDGWMR
jgi:hypothetical protein